MSARLLVLLVLLTGCAEETEGEGSLEMRGVGLVIPWPVLALVVLGVVLLLRRRR